MALRMHCGTGQSQMDGKEWRNEVAVGRLDKEEGKREVARAEEWSSGV